MSITDHLNRIRSYSLNLSPRSRIHCFDWFFNPIVLDTPSSATFQSPSWIYLKDYGFWPDEFLPLFGSGSLFSTYLYLHGNKINKKGPTIIHKSVIRLSLRVIFMLLTMWGGDARALCLCITLWLRVEHHGIKKKSNNMAQFDTPMRDRERVYDDALVDMVHVIILTCPFFLSR